MVEDVIMLLEFIDKMILAFIQVTYLVDTAIEPTNRDKSLLLQPMPSYNVTSFHFPSTVRAKICTCWSSDNSRECLTTTSPSWMKPFFRGLVMSWARLRSVFNRATTSSASGSKSNRISRNVQLVS